MPLSRRPQGTAGEERDAAAGSEMHRQATAVPRSVARDQRSTHIPLMSTVPPRPWAPCISAFLHGAVGELGFRRSPVPRGTTSGGRNILTQRGAGALDQGLPPSVASCSSWHFLGAATVPKPPHLPLLLPPPGGTRGTRVTRVSHIPRTGR